MKKFLFAFIALCAIAFTSCISFSVSTEKSSADGSATVKGLLQRDGDYYFIAMSEDPNFKAGTCYFVESENAPGAWKTLTSLVGKHITVNGYVVKYYDDGTKDVAVTEAHQWQQAQ